MRINSTQPSLSKQFVEQQLASMQQLAAAHNQQQQQQHDDDPDQLQQLPEQTARAMREQAFQQVRERMGSTLEKAG